MHVTSLPGPYFNGDLGNATKGFVEFLSRCGTTWWQVLPVNPIGPGNSPYSTTSTFAYEPLLIGLEPLVRLGLLRRKDIAHPTCGDATKVDYRKARRFREGLWQKAYATFRSNRGKLRSLSQSYGRFKREMSWLADYTLFEALASCFGTTNWATWPKDLVERKPAALRRARSELAENLDYLSFLQFLFHCQWKDLRTVCHEKGIGILGDMPIFVGYESADVWANQKLFWLRKDGRPQYVSGAPPDSFNRSGQLWGHALYRWDAMEESGFRWWVERSRQALALFDAVRLDHFIGFHRYWRVAGGARTALRGKWVRARGQKLFEKLSSEFGELPFIAEDLGQVTPAVWALRDHYEFPGMRVLHFGFNSEDGNDYHMPHQFDRNCVVYTGTHDNDTSSGWFRSLSRGGQRKKREVVKRFLATNGKEIHWDLIRCAMTSVANVAIVPAQDLLGLGSSARMNTPGVAEGNWRWRLKDGDLGTRITRQLEEIVRVTGRGV